MAGTILGIMAIGDGIPAITTGMTLGITTVGDGMAGTALGMIPGIMVMVITDGARIIAMDGGILTIMGRIITADATIMARMDMATSQVPAITAWLRMAHRAGRSMDVRTRMPMEHSEALVRVRLVRARPARPHAQVAADACIAIRMATSEARVRPIAAVTAAVRRRVRQVLTVLPLAAVRRRVPIAAVAVRLVAVAQVAAVAVVARAAVASEVVDKSPANGKVCYLK